MLSLQRFVGRGSLAVGENEDCESYDSSDVRDIEYPGPQATDTHIQEVGYTPVEHNAIDQIAYSASRQERKSGYLPRASFTTKCSYPQQSENDQANSALEHGHTHRFRQARADAEEGPGILDMGDAKSVTEERVGFAESEMSACHALRDLVAANAAENEDSNKRQTPDVSHTFHTPSNC
jgi:hypothetical protein